MRYTLRLLVFGVLCLGNFLGLKAQEAADKTLSPYFIIKNGDPTVDQLPLKSTSASVEIAGVIADVKVTQVYSNAGTRPLEAVYTFPGSTRAAVYAMTMRIGERELKAVIHEKAKARQVYEQAKQEGRSASLLEQHRPNVFQMNVAHILPGDEIHVEMHYTELLVPADGEYQFVYPTVVGPRYGGIPGTVSATGEKWVASPYTKAGELPFASFGMDLRLNAGMPIQTMTCGTHKTSITYEGAQIARLALDPSEAQGGNRDFILTYRLKGGQIQSGLLLARGEKAGDENFFMLMMQPPRRVEPEMMPAREYVFILDVSGSMSGGPLSVAKKLMNQLVAGLRPQDRFNVMCFEGGSSFWSEAGSKPATFWNVLSAKLFINCFNGGGGTEMLSAIKRAVALPRKEGISRTFVIATDGYVSADYHVLEYLHDHLGDANMFAFGVGTSVNRFLIEGMARAGMGEAFVVDKSTSASKVVKKFREYIASPVLTNIRLAFHDFDAYDVEPKQIPDVLAERPILCFGKWRGEPKGTITLEGVSGNGNYVQSFAAGSGEMQTSCAALRNIWARNKIQLLGDCGRMGGRNGQREITDLGLKYNLLTDYTSFVAVDKLVRNPAAESITVDQPLPLPQGVSNLAVGAPAGPGSRPSAITTIAAAASVERVDGGVLVLKDRSKELGLRVVLEQIQGDSALVPGSDLRFLVEQIMGELLQKEILHRGFKATLELSFDAGGALVSIDLSPENWDLKTTLEQALKDWRIPNATGKTLFKLRFSLEVRA
jgi:Ca-activated chloride channel family protein